MLSSARYIQSVDGLRAVAVLAVLLYHLGIDWIPGGFLAVSYTHLTLPTNREV